MNPSIPIACRARSAPPRGPPIPPPLAPPPRLPPPTTTFAGWRKKRPTLPARPERSCETETTENRMTDPIPARVAALKTMPMPDLKAQWRALFDTEPPPFNRRHLENRIAYRIQELAYGGLKPETIRRLEILGEQYDSDNVTTRRIRHDARPVAGTRLVREYRASSTPSRCWPTATSGRAGRTARSRRSPAPSPAPAGTAWCSSGSSARGARHDEADHPQAPLRGLHPEVHRGGAGAGVQLAARPARGLRGLRRQPALRGLGADPRALRRRRLLRRHAGAPGAEAAARRHRGGAGRRRRGLQDRPAVALADGLLEAGRGVRPRRRHLRLGHPVVQHHDLDGAADAQHPALLRPVRARGHRRAHPRQDQGVAAEGHVDGRQRAARLRGEGPEARGARARGGDRRGRSSSGSSGSARRRCWRGSCGTRACAPSAASSSTRATSTSC